MCDNCKINDDGEVVGSYKKNISIKLSFKGVKNYPYIDTLSRQRRWSRKLTTKYHRGSYRYNNTNGKRSRY